VLSAPANGVNKGQRSYVERNKCGGRAIRCRLLFAGCQRWKAVMESPGGVVRRAVLLQRRIMRGTNVARRVDSGVHVRPNKRQQANRI